MRQNELVHLLRKVIFILLFSFVLFIIIMNILKIIVFDLRVRAVIKALDEDKQINVVNSYSNSINNEFLSDPSPDVLHNSTELGFKNSLYTLNGSEWGEGINILLVGSDKKDFNKNKARSDVIIVLRINKNGKVLSISIPRDTLIPIREGEWRGYSDKIGHSLYWGGMTNLKKNVEWLIGSPIYRVAIIDNFRNFEAYLAVVGGLYIDKRLEGNIGIKWIRNRNFIDGDIERCKRQQIFLKRSTIKLWKITRNGNYFFANYFFDVLKRIIYTDLSKNEFNNVLYILKKNNFNPEKDFLTGILPGEFGVYNSLVLNRDDLKCWILDNEILEKIRILFYSEKENIEFID